MQIHAAASRGDIDGIAWCLKRGIPIDQADDHGTTPLISAAAALNESPRVRHANLETLRYLLECGANPNALGWSKHTAVFAAAGCCNVSALKLLQSCGAELGHIAESDYTAFTSMAYQPASPQKYETMRYLLENQVLANVISTYGESPLSVAALRGDLQAIRLLLDFGVDPAPLEWTPIFHAIAFGSLNDVEAHLTSSLDRNARDRWEQTALLFAIKCGDVTKAELLHKHGYVLSARARCGKTALQIAARQNHPAILSWLLANGASLEETDEAQHTALMAAAEAGALEAIEFLLNANVNEIAKDHVECMAVNRAFSLPAISLLVRKHPEHVNAIDGCGEWPLKVVAGRNDPEAIDALYALGAKIDLTHTGDTALHAAVSADALEAVQRLLELGANPNAQDVDGWTPLCSVRSREVAQLLLSHGADPFKEVPISGKTAHDYAKDPLVHELLPKP